MKAILSSKVNKSIANNNNYVGQMIKDDEATKATSTQYPIKETYTDQSQN